MTETAHARTILSALSSLPITHASDSIADARNYPASSAPILPRMSRPYNPSTTTTSTPQSTSQTTASTRINLTLKPLRPTPTAPTVSLPQTDSSISIWDVKSLAARRTGYAPDKIKVLWQKRPVADSKTLVEVVRVEASGGDVEMGVMFVGAPTAAPVLAGEAVAAETETERARQGAGGGEGESGDVAMGGTETEAAQEKTGMDVLSGDEFWGDLEGFIRQRVGDKEVAGMFVGTWRKWWERAMSGEV